MANQHTAKKASTATRSRKRSGTARGAKAPARKAGAMKKR